MKQINVEIQTNEAQEEKKTGENCNQEARGLLPTMEAKRERLKKRIKHTNHSTYLRLIEACKLKHLATIKSVVSEQPELINQKDKQNRSLLHYASILVLNSSIGYDDRDSNEFISQELADKCIECFNYLTSICDLKLWWQQDYDGLSILHLAVISSNVPLVKHIVFEHPYSIKYPLICTLDNESHSPLHWAVITNNLDCVKLLVNYAGTKLVHEPDLNGATPLHYATQTRDYPKYKYQLKQMLKNVGQEISEQAPAQSNGSVQHETTSTSTSTTTTTITTATDKCSTKVDGTNSYSSSQDQDNQSRILNIVSDQLKGLEILEYLVKLPQINLECKDKDNRTPLLWAASSGNREAIVLLINHGSNLASFDVNRLSALHCAASHGYTDCVECLLSSDSACANSQVNQVDNLNCTPLFYAVLSGNIDCIEILLDRGAKQDWQDTKDRTAAHFAALKGQLNSLKLLRKRNANLWLPNKQGDLPLHYAIKSGRQQVARWLLENSPYEHSVNAINNYGRSPIHLAIMKNNLEMVDYLIKCGANLNQLVKVRDKSSVKPTKTNALNQQQITLVNDSNIHQSKNGTSYKYETALDMAKKLNHGQCLQLLLDNQALSAAQVIRNRINGAPSVSKNANSLFDMQSIEGPSPIGFETSYSSSGASPNMNLIQTGQIPKLSRPAPDMLPQSDSTGSSSLSHNSLTSIRDAPIRLKESVNNKQNSERRLVHEPINIKQDDDSDRDDEEAGQRDTDKPNRGGISYNNGHLNASIKYKLYDQDAMRQESRPRHLNNRSFPTQKEPKMKRQKSITGRAILSAPLEKQNQEIITNVSVYTSPCPHSAHFNTNFCTECCKSSSGRGPGSTKQQSKTRTLEDGFYSDETSETVTTASEEMEVEMLEVSNRLPKLAATRPILVQPMNSNLYESAGKTTFKRYLPPSQNHEQHLPVIISDQEQSTSAGISPESPHIDADKNIVRQQEQHEASCKHDSVETDEDAKQHDSGLGHASPALQEPRFDRSRRYRDGQRADRYREQVRSPVAEYIHAPLGIGYFGGNHTRPVSLNRDVDNLQRHYAQRPNYSQVRAKVDSHGLQYDDPIRSKSMSTLQHRNHHLNQQQPYSRSPYHMYSQQASRSVSRQTVIRRRGSGSVDSLELTTKVEKSIRKHRQEAKIFEELQNLKRSQIRSGRANEALLVKRLVDHFSQDTFNLIGLDTSYHGPYNYQSYERFLYDQLRKLSQSNCVKLAAAEDRDECPTQTQLKMSRIQQTQPHRTDSPQATLASDLPSVSYSDQHFLEEDLKAELELRRVINGGAESDEEGQFDKFGNVGEISQEGLKNIERERIHESEVESTKAGEASSEKSKQERGLKAQRVDEPKQEVDGDLRDDTIASHGASSSSRSSSRRSSADIERERLMNLPLATSERQRALSVEEEARSLSSSIIVDALGNVSRAGSASRRVSMERGNETSASKKEDVSSNIDESAEDSREVVEDSQNDGNEAAEFKPMASNRRRSVVNIGNKMEVIYHDVGIEIDSAVESDNSAGTGRLERSLENNQQEDVVSTSEFGDASNDALENVKEKETEDQDDKQMITISQQQPDHLESTSSQSEKVIDLTTSEELGGTEDSVADTVVDVESIVNRQGSGKSSDSIIVRDSSRNGGIALTRRISSPSAFLVEGDTKFLDSTTANLGRSQRASSIGTELNCDIVEAKKVFNGFDLDEMHHKRGSVQAPEFFCQKSRTNSEEKATQINIDDADINISEIPDEKPNYIASEARRRSSLADKQQVLRVEQDADKIATSESNTLAKITGYRRRRLPRSHLIKGRYIVNVPIEDVKDRWSHIKASERKRKSRIERSIIDSGSNIPREFEFMGDASVQGRSFSLTDDQNRLLPNFTKSQQNLERNLTGESVKTNLAAEDVDIGDAHLNFELLYEINKLSKLAKLGTAESEKLESNRLKWCHKKAIKVVDIRTIKRTLSLPESLIYSNDLLKRFNILKL